MTLNECKSSLEELQDIWDNGNQDSLPFCRYIKQSLEELSWEIIYCNEDVPPDFEEIFNKLEDDVFECWRYLKIKHGECSMTLIPIGE